MMTTKQALHAYPHTSNGKRRMKRGTGTMTPMDEGKCSVGRYPQVRTPTLVPPLCHANGPQTPPDLELPP
jgi:hypothetical protein